MAVEGDAEHLPALALVPVRTLVRRHPRVGVRVALVDVGLERDAPVALRGLDVREHLHPARGPGDAEGHVGRLDRRRRVTARLVALSRCGLPVDAGDEREVVAFELVLAHLGRTAPRIGLHPHHEHAEGVGGLDDPVPELSLEAGQQLLLGVVERA